ncbi:MAG: type VI secretion system contractile sheath large subunit, partial [Caldimonas sp.]
RRRTRKGALMSDAFIPDFGDIGQAAPAWNAKRPMRIAILGDFGAGAGRGRLDTGAELARRKPMKVEFDTLEDAMQRLGLALALPLGADGAPVTIELPDLDAFHPDAIHASVPLFADLASLRRRLNQTGQFPAAAAEVMAWAENAGPSASSLARRAASRGTAPSRGATLDDFARLTGRHSAASASDDSLDGLLQRVVGPFVHAAASPKKDELVAAVDAGLSDAMRALLHHPDFQTSESLWRGVDFVLRRLETNHQLQVHLIDISAEEFAADLSSAADLSDSGLYRLLVDSPSQEADGGYAYVAGCYRFDATPPHAEILGRAAQVASHAGASLLVGINTDPFADRKEAPHRLVTEAFAALRALPAASFLGLFGPRFLLRHPYGKKSDPISAFAFEEFSREAGLRGMLWGHPALLALTVLARHGAPLTAEDLPFHHYVDEDGDSVALPCTDRLISANVASLLREAGINALMAHKGDALVRFFGLEAVNGDGLAAAGGAPRKAAGEARFAVQSKVDARGSRASATFSPAVRKAGAARAVVEEPVVDEPADETADEVEDAGEPANDANDEVAVEGGEASEVESEGADDVSAVDSRPSDDELSTLLASFDEPAASVDADEASTEEPIDPELAALLKSLG